MPESIINIAVGDLVRQKGTGHPSTDRVLERKDQTGVVVRLYETKGELAMWSPLTAEILWSDGALAAGFLVLIVKVIQNV